MGEKLLAEDDLGWMSGTRATLRNTGTPFEMAGSRGHNTYSSSLIDASPDLEAEVPKELKVGGFGSYHWGANFLFGDGAVRTVSADIAPAALRQLGNRHDGELLEDGPTRTR